ncbi:MAG: glycosyltransferase family 4 protein [Sphingomicrobium sp.]
MAGDRNKQAPRASGPLIALSANDGWGVVNFRRGLIAALQADGYRIAVLAPDGPNSDAIRAQGAQFVPLSIVARGRSPTADLATLTAYWRQLRALRPAAYLGFTIKPNIYGSIAAHALGIPVINNITGLGAMFERKGPLNRLVGGLYRVALGRSAKVFFQNRDDRDLFVERRLVRADQAALLPGSGVDLDFFQPRSGPEHDGTTFLLAARLLWAKGVREFVEAARIVRSHRDDVCFHILGPIEPSGPDAVAKSDLDRWSQEGVVDYRGSAADVRVELAEADCAVLPSYYREGVPRILLEAAAMAIPVIAADSVGCRDAVKPGETGFLCAPRSAQSLADAMQRIAGMTDAERLAMGLAGRAWMERDFDEAVVHQAYREALLGAFSKGI